MTGVLKTESMQVRSECLPCHSVAVNHDLCGCFCKLDVLFVGVLMIRTLLFGVSIRALDFWKPSCPRQSKYQKVRGIRPKAQ